MRYCLPGVDEPRLSVCGLAHACWHQGYQRLSARDQLKTPSMRWNSDRSLSGRKYQQSFTEYRDNNVSVGADNMRLMLVHSVLRDCNSAFTLTVPNNIPAVGLVSGGYHLGERGSAGGDKRLQVWGESCVICLAEGPSKFLEALQTLRNRLREVIGTDSDIGSNQGSEGDALVR